MLIIPTTDNFCFIANFSNVDTIFNQRLYNYIDKEEKNQLCLPFIPAFKKWRISRFVMKPFNEGCGDM